MVTWGKGYVNHRKQRAYLSKCRSFEIVRILKAPDLWRLTDAVTWFQFYAESLEEAKAIAAEWLSESKN